MRGTGQQVGQHYPLWQIEISLDGIHRCLKRDHNEAAFERRQEYGGPNVPILEAVNCGEEDVLAVPDCGRWAITSQAGSINV